MTTFSEVFSWFQINYKDLVTSMKLSNHHYNETILNPWHLEGDVWTHTMMVVSHAIQKSSFNEVHIAALLHDIGKVNMRQVNEETQRVRFLMHENISTYKAIDIINNIINTFPNYKLNLVETLLLINWHSFFHKIGSFDLNNEYDLSSNEKNKINYIFGQNIDLYIKLQELSYSDNEGRIQLVNENEKNIKKYKYFENFIPTQIYSNVANRPEFLMLIGLPNAGKSTFIKEYTKDKDFVIISSDNEIEEMFPNLNYNQAFLEVQNKNLFGTIENILMKKLKKAIEERKNIIFDRTNLRISIRNKWLSYVPDKYYQKNATMFLIGETVLKDRNIKRSKLGKHIPKSFSIPSLEEFDKIDFIY